MVFQILMGIWKATWGGRRGSSLFELNVISWVSAVSIAPKVERKDFLCDG
jgi:hypothetical protein